MTRRAILLAAGTVALLAIGSATSVGRARAAGCDVVPERYAGLQNPVRGLSEQEVSYWTRQFKTKCARCHGKEGRGGGEEAATQKVPPASLADQEFMAACSDGQLFYQIMMGGEDKSAMPDFGPESSQGWSEDKVWHMVAFIRRFAQ